MRGSRSGLFSRIAKKKKAKKKKKKKKEPDISTLDEADSFVSFDISRNRPLRRGMIGIVGVPREKKEK